jgi:hypothetical protein
LPVRCWIFTSDFFRLKAEAKIFRPYRRITLQNSTWRIAHRAEKWAKQIVFRHFSASLSVAVWSRAHVQSQGQSCSLPSAAKWHLCEGSRPLWTFVRAWPTGVLSSLTYPPARWPPRTVFPLHQLVLHYQVLDKELPLVVLGFPVEPEIVPNDIGEAVVLAEVRELLIDVAADGASVNHPRDQIPALINTFKAGRLQGTTHEGDRRIAGGRLSKGPRLVMPYPELPLDNLVQSYVCWPIDMRS